MIQLWNVFKVSKTSIIIIIIIIMWYHISVIYFNALRVLIFICFRIISKHQFAPSLLLIPLIATHAHNVCALQPFTSKAFNAGKDIDGAKLHICRTHRYGQIIPGKYSDNIGKCSVTHNRRETQFVRYELLIESDDARYEWIDLKKPVHSLPENVLYAGNRQAINAATFLRQQLPSTIVHANGTVDVHSVDRIISSDKNWGVRKRRYRRSSRSDRSRTPWNHNWRGISHLSQSNASSLLPISADAVRSPVDSGVETIYNFDSRQLKLRREKMNNFTKYIDKIKKCHSYADSIRHRMQDLLPISRTLVSDDNRTLCPPNPQRNYYYIGKCALRTGDTMSEQVGKIWWNESIQEWIASFSFGGHEIYCFDFSVLTLKN